MAKKNKRIRKVIIEDDPLSEYGAALKNVIKLTPQVMRGMVDLLTAHMTIKVACGLMCISSASHYKWMRWGRGYNEAKEMGEELEANRRLYADYEVAVRFALAKWESGVITRSLVPDYFTDTWIRDMTVLERRCPEDWGKTTIVMDREEFYDPNDTFL